MINFPPALDNLLMAQQPIVRKSKAIQGYQLSFLDKNTSETKNHMMEGNTLIDLCHGIKELEYQLNKSVFININAEILKSADLLPIDPDTLYIEISAEKEVTPEFWETIATWRRLGYRFVLNDYKLTDQHNKLLRLVSVVRINALTASPEKHKKEITALKRSGIMILADNIRDFDMFEQYQRFNFDLFQGEFLQKPEPKRDNKIAPDIYSVISLVNLIQNKDISIETISNLVKQSPQLSDQLLSILKSPVCGLTKTITSIKEAIIYLGLSQVERWALFLTIKSSPNAPLSIFKILLTRGRCCQLLAEEKNSRYADEAFMTGLMSGIDVLLGLEKKTLLKEISLNKQVHAAIVNKSGELGNYLTQTLNCEERKWEEIQGMTDKDRKHLNQAFLQAMIWGENTIRALA